MRTMLVAAEVSQSMTCVRLASAWLWAKVPEKFVTEEVFQPEMPLRGNAVLPSKIDAMDVMAETSQFSRPVSVVSLALAVVLKNIFSRLVAVDEILS